MVKLYCHTCKRIMCIVLTCVLLNACYDDSKIKLPPFHPRLVVHAYVETGTYFELAVSKTSASDGTLASYSDYVVDAKVVLFDNGVAKDTLLYNNSSNRYISSKVVAVSGHTYKIMVSATGMPAVEATALAPAQVTTDFVARTRNAQVDANNQWLDDVTLRFHDPANEKNHYRIRLDRDAPSGSSYPTCVYTYDQAVEQYQNSLDPFANSSCIDNDKILMSDASFNGVDKQVTISGIHSALEEYSFNNVTYKPYLKKYTISEDYYRYIKDVIALNIIQDNPFMQAFVIKGNVKNGYGLFTVYAATTDTLQ